MKIEAQVKYMETMGQSYQSKPITRKPYKPFVATTAPHSKESESLETQHEEEVHRSSKKQRIIEEDVFPTSSELGSSTTAEFHNQTWNLTWSQLAAVACQSPLVHGFLL